MPSRSAVPTEVDGDLDISPSESELAVRKPTEELRPRRSRRGLGAYVFQSAYDGSAMRRVAEIGLDYERGRLRFTSRWENVTLDRQAWDDETRRVHIASNRELYAMPVLVDIEIDGAGNMVASLRDRLAADTPHYIEWHR
jgi:hypothetical protein